MVDLSLKQTERHYQDLKRSQFIVYSNQLKEVSENQERKKQEMKRLEGAGRQQSLLQHLKRRLSIEQKWHDLLQTKMNPKISPNLMVMNRRDLMWSMRTQYDALPNS